MAKPKLLLDWENFEGGRDRYAAKFLGRWYTIYKSYNRRYYVDYGYRQISYGSWHAAERAIISSYDGEALTRFEEDLKLRRKHLQLARKYQVK
jgi:hypothetical protein